MAADVKKLLEEHGRLEDERNLWKNHWQLVAEYVMQRKATFTTFEEPGAFINSEIWSDLAGKAAETSSSAFLGLVWPDNYSFKLEPLDEFKDDEELKAFFDEATETIQSEMDNPEAGLGLALDEFMTDYIVFGTPTMYVEEGETTAFKFEAWNLSQYCIDENAAGYINTFMKGFMLTTEGMVEKFGTKNVSRKVQELFKSGKLKDKHKVLHVIKPRSVLKDGGKGAQNMPFMSVYIEVEAKSVLRESGYHELPAFCARYSKRIGEKYGRSPSMRALPTIMELNSLWEMVTMGIEKSYDPPLALLDDGKFGGGTIDTSAGALNVLRVSGNGGNQNPIQQLFTVGSLSEVSVLLEKLEATVNDHYMIDRLIDFNNEQQMTAREFVGRQAIRQSTLRSPVTRIISELFTPLIERCFNIMLRAGKLGYVEGSPEAQAWQAANPNEDMRVIPQSLLSLQGKKKRIYWVRYMSPAVREQQSEEAQGIMNLYQFIGSVAPMAPELVDEMNHERASKRLGDIWAVPQECFNTKDEKEATQKAKAGLVAQQQQMMQLKQGAGVVKDLAAAAK